MTFAENTSVSVEKSRSELETMLMRAGATQRAVLSDDEKGTATVVFKIDGRHVRLTIPLPKLAPFMTESEIGKRRPWGTPEARRGRWEQACRARWRAMVLLVKAKLEAIEIGLSTFEREFLPDIFLADGRTVHEALVEDLERHYLDGSTPLRLGPGPTP